MTDLGMVYLVGAGPGDPGLITVKGLRLLREADVIVSDRLVDPHMLEEARPDAEQIDAGKGRGQRRMEQEEINTLLIRLARKGKRVVRLKGGDPFLFGRGGEEAEALAEAGVPFAVVPGVTSAIAAPAYAGIPVTHRAVASSLCIVTGSEDPSREDSRIDWRSLAQADTLVVLMGVEALPSIVAAILKAGKAPETPIALVRWGAEPYQKTVTGTLQDIVKRVETAELKPPAVIVVGEVVRLRDKLTWFDNGPLFGKRVLVTRTRQQASTLCQLLAQEGAWPLELPTIVIEPVEDLSGLDVALARLSDYRWVLFTSANAVGLFFARLRTLGRDPRAFGKAQICAIGTATERALKAQGLRPDYVPPEFVPERLLEGLQGRVALGDRVLLPRALGGRDILAEGLRAAGALVEEMPLYRAAPPSDLADGARKLIYEGVDAATFTSSSTVRNLVELLDGDLKALRSAVVACIGPVTAETAQELGLQVDVVAQEYTVPGLVGALREYFSSR